MPDLPEYPWSSECSPSDHDSVNAVIVEHHLCPFRSVDITVANNGNLNPGVLLYLADEGPVGLATVKLCPCAAVNRQPGNACILKPFSHIHNYPAVVIPSQSRLDSHRFFHGFDDCRGHLNHERYILQHSGTGSPGSYFSDRASVVDVNQVRSCRLSHQCCINHRFNNVAVELDSDRTFIIKQVKLLYAAPSVTYQSV